MDNVVFDRRYGDLAVRVFAGTGPSRSRCQSDLLDRGFPMSLSHRVEWADQMLADPTESLFLAVTDRTGACGYGFGIRRGESRALPGHCVLRVERLRGSGNQKQERTAIDALHDLASSDNRILRTHIELFSRNDGVRAALGRTLGRIGSRPLEQPTRSYRQTLVLDVTPCRDVLFRQLSSTARRYIRAVAKHPVRIGKITDERYAPRVSALLAESFGRTGGTPPTQDWKTVMDFSKRNPALSRLVGLFRTDDDSPDGLLAFEWAVSHGDHVEDVLAGATRPEDLKISLAMPLVWDVALWSKGVGASWLDFGGVPGNADEKAETLRGITDFKLRFTQRVETVGEEWIFEPRPLRSRLALAIGKIARLIRGGRHSLEVLLPSSGLVAPMPF